MPQSAQRSSESELTVPTFSMQTAHGSIRSDSNNSFVLSLSAISTTLCGTACRGRSTLGHTALPLASLLPPEFPLLPSGRAVTYTRPFPNAMAGRIFSDEDHRHPSDLSFPSMPSPETASLKRRRFRGKRHKSTLGRYSRATGAASSFTDCGRRSNRPHHLLSAITASFNFLCIIILINGTDFRR
jgi:hypothetical protein